MNVQNEVIKFRIFVMPCCRHLLCWVNPRLPNYCPECGKEVYMKLRFQLEYTLVNDENAVLRHNT